MSGGLLVAVAVESQEVSDVLRLDDGSTGGIDADEEGSGTVGPGRLQSSGDGVRAAWRRWYSF